MNHDLMTRMSHAGSVIFPSQNVATLTVNPMGV